MSARIPDDVVAELKRAFSAFDKDGNGMIDRTELVAVLGELGHKDVGDTEVQTLMSLMDEDQNGTVELSEFLKTMADWMQPEDAKRGVKRKADPAEARQEIHRKILKFFLQFRTVPDFEAVRIRMNSWDYGYKKTDNVDAEDVIDVPGMSTKEYTADEKQEYMLKFRSGNLHELCLSLQGASNWEEALAPMETVTHLLNATNVFRTPMERREIGDDLLQLFEALHPHVPRLCHFLQFNYPQLQLLVLRALTYLAPGPRIAATPVDLYMHPSKPFFKKLIVDANGIPYIVELLSSPYQPLREQAMLCLATIARHHEEYRDLVLSPRYATIRGIMRIFEGSLFGVPDVVRLQKGTWALSIFCGDTHRNPPNWNLVREVIPLLAELFLKFDQGFYYDEDVLQNTLRALMFLLPGVLEGGDNTICRRLVTLLGHRSRRVQVLAIEAVCHLLGDDGITQRLLEADLLVFADQLLKCDALELREGGIRIVKILVGLKGQANAVFNRAAEMLSSLSTVAVLDPMCRNGALEVFRHLSRGSSAHIRYMVEALGIVPTLCSCLQYFKYQDQVMASVWNFAGSSFNFDLVANVLEALSSILNIGEIEADATGSENPYCEKFDLQCLQYIGGVLAEIKLSPQEVVDAWRHNKPGQMNTEEIARTVLVKVLVVAEKYSTSDANAVASEIKDMLRRYFDLDARTAKKASGSSHHVLIKCTLNDDVRVVSYPRNVQFSVVQADLERRYHCRLLLKYKDHEGDYVTVDSQAVFEAALAFFGDATTKFSLTVVTGVPIPGSPAGKAVDLAVSPNSPAKSVFSPSKVSPGKLPSNAGSLGFLPGNINLNGVGQENKPQLLKDLQVVSRFGMDELERLYVMWKAMASSDGMLTKEQFAKGLSAIGCADPLMVEQNMHAFDADRNGRIDFREYVVGLSTLQKGSTLERLRLIFNSYDLDGNGVLTGDEVYRIFKAAQNATNDPCDDAALQKTVQEVFHEIDKNKDGAVSFEEFVEAVRNDKLSAVSMLHHVS